MDRPGFTGNLWVCAELQKAVHDTNAVEAGQLCRSALISNGPDFLVAFIASALVVVIGLAWWLGCYVERFARRLVSRLDFGYRFSLAYFEAGWSHGHSSWIRRLFQSRPYTTFGNCVGEALCSIRRSFSPP